MKMPAAPQGGGTFEAAPAGNHLATCFYVIDLGTHTVVQPDKSKQQRQIRIGWELSHEMMDDGRPYTVYRKYNLSSHEKSTLRKHLESWRGKKFEDAEIEEFDLKNLLGKSCFIQVVHNQSGDKTYANVDTIASLPKGTQTPELHGEKVYLSLEAGDFNQSAFDALPEFWQDMIKESPEYQALYKGRGRSMEDYAVPAEGFDDTNPF